MLHGHANCVNILLVKKEHRTKLSASCGTPMNRSTNGIADKAVSPLSIDFRRRAGKKIRQDDCVEFIRASLKSLWRS